MPTVSIIIPTYNRARFITKAIESVLAQTFTEYEIIVVDDGSFDETRRVLTPYFDRIRYLYQDNAGVSAARNAGIEEARGAWIGFLDSDDEWMPDYLAIQIASVRRFPHAVAHVTNSIGISAENEPHMDHFAEVGLVPKFRGRRQIMLSRPFRTVVSRTHWFLQPVIMRRDALLKAGLFDRALSIGEDMDVVARLALQGPFTLYREVLVAIYRRREETVCLSAQYMTRGIHSRKCFCRVFAALMRLPGLTLGERLALLRAMSEKWRAIGNLYLKGGNPPQARQYYGKSFLAYPNVRSVVKYLGGFLPQGAALLVMRQNDISPGDEGE